MNSANEGDDDRQFYQTTHHYWTNQDTSAPAFMGVATYGGGGLLESDFRHREEVRRIKLLAPFNSGTKILELGCGNGRWILELAPTTKYYEAVDFSDQMLELAKTRVKDAGIDNVTFFQASLESYIPSTNFDVIYLSGVSLYLSDKDLKTALKRLRDYLTPDGVLIERSTFHRNEREVIEHRPDDQYAAIYRTPSQAVELFRSAGLEIIKEMESYDYFNFPPQIIALLNKRMILNWLKRHYSLSFFIIRHLCRFNNNRKGPPNDMIFYTHRFMSFKIIKP